METTERYVSVIAPLAPAFQRVKTLLFQPFQLERWLVLGFCAWLAFLGKAGTSFGGGTGPTTGGGDWGNGRGMENVRDAVHESWNWVVSNLDWLLQLAFVILVLILAIWLLVIWLSSRGQFMFLYGVAGHRPEVVRPWNEYAVQGHSLFVFRVALNVVVLLLMLPLMAGVGWSVYGMISEGKADTAGIASSAVLGVLAMGWGMLAAAVGKLTQDFVVPIMYLRALSCWDGWKEFRGLLGGHFWVIVLYLLFQIVLMMAIQLGTFLVVVVTCCLAGCVLAIPYVGTVFFLPVLVFTRAYSLYFLAQFGPRYNVFRPETARVE